LLVRRLAFRKQMAPSLSEFVGFDRLTDKHFRRHKCCGQSGKSDCYQTVAAR
jgi:hypothetical protein